ncbi:hypothetical protein HOO65_070610 [Ceratocystis lukuohia]|uniref:Uncharacterized protein n=2 Tax=Ceratocystis TaxID=5157 RepID=A0A0F8B2J7_CERFI|nr:hypothetical protein CFO_g2041 [Ceratocystis platani]
MVLLRKFTLLNVAALAITGAVAHSSKRPQLGKNAKQLLDQSMDWMDDFYDEKAGYLYDFSAAVALRHETRSSAWYAFGLLARNHGSDVKNAEKIITNIIGGQFKDPKDQWYGDYQQEPEEPELGSPAYPPTMYGSWDPNWRGFIGTTFIMMMEEFPHLLSNGTQDLILESLHNATKGDEYRVGGVDDDNLYASYSNPSIMRAFASGWTGRRLGEANMTTGGEQYAKEIIDLFNRNNTLSEFNSGTYTGVSLYGLLLWSKYLPDDSIMRQNGPRMLLETWKAVSQLWHPGMKNMAGPWDRSYGFDMNRYVSLMSLWFWIFLGKENSSLIEKPYVMSHMADYAYAPLFAVLGAYHKSLLPAELIKGLSTFSGEHTFTASTYYPPYDYYPRNITTWLSENITIGAEAFNENVVGGPARSQTSFNPAVVQWKNGEEIMFISLYSTEKSMLVDVAPNKLKLTYPNGTADSIFSFIVASSPDKVTYSGWEDVPGITVTAKGNVNLTHSLDFAGTYGGANKPIRDFEFWNFTYSMPQSFVGTPYIELSLIEN